MVGNFRRGRALFSNETFAWLHFPTVTSIAILELETEKRHFEKLGRFEKQSYDMNPIATGTYRNYYTIFPNEAADWLHFPPYEPMGSTFRKLIMRIFIKSRLGKGAIPRKPHAETKVNSNSGKI